MTAETQRALVFDEFPLAGPDAGGSSATDLGSQTQHRGVVIPMNLIDRRAEISDCGRYRWTLSRDWTTWSDRSTSRGLVVMFNPSTADGRTDDPTIQRLIGWHQRWGFGGFTVANLLPLRSPNPDDALDWLELALRDDGDERRALQRNLGELKSLAYAASQVLVAWGRLPASMLELANNVLEDLEDQAGDLHCLGLTQAGFPIHPMARGKHRVPDHITPQRFERADHP